MRKLAALVPRPRLNLIAYLADHFPRFLALSSRSIDMNFWKKAVYSSYPPVAPLIDGRAHLAAALVAVAVLLVPLPYKTGLLLLWLVCGLITIASGFAAL